MSTTEIVDATTTEQRSGSEPQSRRRRTYVVTSDQRLTFAVRDIHDFTEALLSAGAPFSTFLRIDKDAGNYMTIVAEWSETVDEETKS